MKKPKKNVARTLPILKFRILTTKKKYEVKGKAPARLLGTTIMINGKRETCIVDTGASHNIFLPSFDLKKKRNGKVTGVGVGGTSESHFVHDFISDDGFKLTTCAHNDLSAVMQLFKGNVKILLGLPFLRDNKISINFGEL